MVEQALIAASGYGTRLSLINNPEKCKSLITYGGQTMIGHLIDGLVQGGIKRFVFCAGEHTLQPISGIVQKKGIQAQAIVEHRHHETYRRIPLIWQSELEDQFLFVCGHHPLPGSFVSQLLAASRESDCVITSYSSLLYPLRDKSHEIVYEENGKFREVEIQPDAKITYHKYVRNPYVVKKDVIGIAQFLDFKYSFSYYMLRYWQMGGSVSAVTANMPPEFDYDDELDRTRLFIDSLVVRLASLEAVSCEES